MQKQIHYTHGFLEIEGATRNSKFQTETNCGTYRHNQETNKCKIKYNIKHGCLEIAGATRNLNFQTGTQFGTYGNNQANNKYKIKYKIKH
jgi:hypothetical protein